MKSTEQLAAILREKLKHLSLKDQKIALQVGLEYLQQQKEKTTTD